MRGGPPWQVATIANTLKKSDHLRLQNEGGVKSHEYPSRSGLSYQVVQDVVDELLVALPAKFDVDVVQDDCRETFSSVFGDQSVRLIRFVPSDPLAAKLALGFADFPGVVAQFGRWGFRAYPPCGCNECNESPTQVASDLREDVDAIVHGRYDEELHGGFWPKLTESFDYTNSQGTSTTTRLTRREYRRLGPARNYKFAAWPPNGSTETDQ